MKTLIKKKGFEGQISCDSAATGNFHDGGPADSRMRKHASRRGYQLTSISRQVVAPRDFMTFDLIVAMDNQNYFDLKQMNRNRRYDSKIVKMTDYCLEKTVSEVPDPYYGGDEGFEDVIDILEDACHGLLYNLIDDD